MIILSEWLLALHITLSPGFGTTSDQAFYTHKTGDRTLFLGTFRVGTAAAMPAFLTLPSGQVIDFNTLPSKKSVVGQWSAKGVDGAAVTGGEIFTLNENTKLFFGDAVTMTRPDKCLKGARLEDLKPATVNTLFNSNAKVVMSFEIPLKGKNK